MPFNELMLNCIQEGSSYNENNIKVRMTTHQKEETVLFFVIDEQSNCCSKFRDLMKLVHICDLLIYYSKKDKTSTSRKGESTKKTICLVELKGSDIKKAVEQITETQKGLSDSLRTKYTNILWKALIISHGASPKLRDGSIKSQLNKIFFNEKNYRIETSTYDYDADEFIRGEGRFK